MVIGGVIIYHRAFSGVLGSRYRIIWSEVACFLYFYFKKLRDF